MKTVEIYCRGVCCGEASLREDEERMEISAEVDDPGDGLYRAVLVCRRGELSLGVLEPRDGKLALRRRPEKSELARLGEISCVRVGCSFRFGKKAVWKRTAEPALLLRDAFLHSRLERFTSAMWRRERGRLLLALPLRDGEPFPLESIFCFACAQRVEGELCAVYMFNEQEEPVMPDQ